MESKDLVKVWAAPDNTKLTPRQMSIRLPLHVAAKISALCELFPTRSRTEIIGDLLATALDEVAVGFPADPYPGELEEAERNGAGVTELEESVWGPRKHYYGLVEKHEKELAAELSEGDQTAGTPDQSPKSAPLMPAGARRAPTKRGASARPTMQARPEAGPRGDQQDRKRGPGRRPAKG